MKVSSIGELRDGRAGFKVFDVETGGEIAYFERSADSNEYVRFANEGAPADPVEFGVGQIYDEERKRYVYPVVEFPSGETIAVFEDLERAFEYRDLRNGKRV